jgi:hypothetical protein
VPSDGGPCEPAEAIARLLPPSEDGTSQTELAGLFGRGRVNGFVNRVGKSTRHGQVGPWITHPRVAPPTRNRPNTVFFDAIFLSISPQFLLSTQVDVALHHALSASVLTLVEA